MRRHAQCSALPCHACAAWYHMAASWPSRLPGVVPQGAGGMWDDGTASITGWERRPALAMLAQCYLSHKTGPRPVNSMCAEAHSSAHGCRSEGGPLPSHRRLRQVGRAGQPARTVGHPPRCHLSLCALPCTGAVCPPSDLLLCIPPTILRAPISFAPTCRVFGGFATESEPRSAADVLLPALPVLRLPLLCPSAPASPWPLKQPSLLISARCKALLLPASSL